VTEVGGNTCPDNIDDNLLNEVIYAAAEGGHEAIVRLCHDEWDVFSGDYCLNNVMAKAAKGGYEEIVRLCHDVWGAPDVQTAMDKAAGGGHEAIVRLCHDKWGAKKM
jgi:hypothetical protein